MTFKFLVVSSRLGEKTQKAGSWWRELAAIGGARGEKWLRGLSHQSFLDEGAGGEEIILTLDKENILPSSGPVSGLVKVHCKSQSVCIKTKISTFSKANALIDC